MSLRVDKFQKLKWIIILTIFIQMIWGAIKYNEKCSINNESWAVGDSGVVMRLKDDSIIYQQILLNGDYNFTSVSFATPAIGWIVGYKRDEPNKMQGIILKTIDRGQTWLNLRCFVPSFPKPTPFLRVHAFNKYMVLVICGNNYFLRTIDGGMRWFRSSKPINNIILN